MNALIDALTIAVTPHRMRNGANDNDPGAPLSAEHPVGAAACRTVDRVDGLVTRIAAWRRRSHRRRHTIRELDRLSDRNLADIGLHRGEIVSVVDRLIAGGAANDNRADLAS